MAVGNSRRTRLSPSASVAGCSASSSWRCFSTPSFWFRGRNYPTHDNLIGRYDGADGIKTGYTGMSGFNLVSSVVRGNTHVIGVVMGGRTAHMRDRAMGALLDNAFARIL